MKYIQIRSFKRKYKYLVETDTYIDIDVLFRHLGTRYIISRFYQIRGNCIIVKGGYCWDGATCFPDIKSIMLPALVHDILYQALREEHLHSKYRQVVDKIFMNVCISQGMNKILAHLVYLAVRLFGKHSAKPEKYTNDIKNIEIKEMIF